jgi:hypothetical protein
MPTLYALPPGACLAVTINLLQIFVVSCATGLRWRHCCLLDSILDAWVVLCASFAWHRLCHICVDSLSLFLRLWLPFLLLFVSRLRFVAARSVPRRENQPLTDICCFLCHRIALASLLLAGLDFGCLGVVLCASFAWNRLCHICVDSMSLFLCLWLPFLLIFVSRL